MGKAGLYPSPGTFVQMSQTATDRRLARPQSSRACSLEQMQRSFPSSARCVLINQNHNLAMKFLCSQPFRLKYDR